MSSVPNASTAMPKVGVSASGRKSLVVKKLVVLARKAGTACTTRNTAMATMMATIAMPAAPVSAKKARSARLPDAALSAGAVNGLLVVVNVVRRRPRLQEETGPAAGKCAVAS